ncbi:hypothetical protein ABZ322_15070, partial [Streptomyces sp. NPDC006129]
SSAPRPPVSRRPKRCAGRAGTAHSPSSATGLRRGRRGGPPGERLAGARAVGVPPKAVRTWRQAVAGGATRREAVEADGTTAA